MNSRLISFFLLVFINGIFLFKYLPRYIPHAEIISFTWLLCQILLYFLLQKHLSYFSNKFRNVYAHLWSFILLVLGIYASFFVDPYSLKTDRWLTILNFWKGFFAGKYPYTPELYRGNKPATLFMYYVMLLPFLKIVPVFSALGYIWLLQKLRKSPTCLGILILFPSFSFIFYEIYTGSNIVTNSLIMLLALKFWDTQLHRKPYLTSIFVGLVLATRTVLALPIIGYFLKKMKERPSLNTYLKLFKSAIIIIFTLVSSSLIIFFLFPEDWQTNNPFSSMSTHFLPTKILIMFVLLASAYLFFTVTKFPKEIIFHIGIALFLLISFYALYFIFTVGFKRAYYFSRIDVTYFLFSVPYFFIAISSEHKL